MLKNIEASKGDTNQISALSKRYTNTTEDLLDVEAVFVVVVALLVVDVWVDVDVEAICQTNVRFALK